MMKIKVLGPAETGKTNVPKKPAAPTAVPTKPVVAPVEKAPNTATQGI